MTEWEPLADGEREREVPLCPWSHQWVTTHFIPWLQTRTHTRTPTPVICWETQRGGETWEGKNWTDETNNNKKKKKKTNTDGQSVSMFVSVSFLLSFIYIVVGEPADTTQLRSSCFPRTIKNACHTHCPMYFHTVKTSVPVLVWCPLRLPDCHHSTRSSHLCPVLLAQKMTQAGKIGLFHTLWTQSQLGCDAVLIPVGVAPWDGRV